MVKINNNYHVTRKGKVKLNPSKFKSFLVKESGFTGHIFKARTQKEAFEKYKKKYGTYGGAISIREYIENRGTNSDGTSNYVYLLKDNN